jgi:methionyl-tRNA formyltransferase
LSYVYIGTDDFAAAVLRSLVEAGYRPALVISRPDAPKGRGRVLSPPPVAEVSFELELTTIQPDEIGSSEVDAAIDAVNPAALALCAYGAIIREPLLTKRPILNLHPSLLPRWRGATPIERSIMEGDSETGVSIIKLVEELDAGPIASQSAIPISPEDNFGSLSERLVDLGARLLAAELDNAEAGALAFTDQVNEGVTYAERFTAEDRFLDQSAPATNALRRLRALTPHVGARLRLRDGEVLGIRAASLSSSTIDHGDISFEGSKFLLGFADGTLEVERLVPPGGKEMSASDWLRGRDN